MKSCPFRPLQMRKLNSVTVGNHNLNLSSAAELIGKYVKYYVRADMTTTQQERAICSPANAFKVMMDTSRTASKNSGQLSLIANVRNNRDRLYNDMVSFIQTSSRKWQSSEISNGIASRCVSTLRDALWYIDEMHDILNERFYKVPSVFSQFTEYSKPESHRHRKCTMLSMSREELLIKVKSLTQSTRNVTKKL